MAKMNTRSASVAVAAVAFMAVSACATIIMLAGCATSDIASDGEWQELVQAGVTHLTNKLSRITADNHGATSTSGDGGAATVAEGAGAFPVVVEPASGCDPAAAGSSTADALDFSSLQWVYGGFDGKNAASVAGCVIVDLRISSSGMSYRWQSGGCEALGAHSRTDSGETLACLFVRDRAGSWRGGKFDWISTSRTSRDWKNVRSGYHGWPTDAIETATDYAFVIVSKDGKRRSNVIVKGK